MSETAIDAYRVASVLGYCLLPMVGVGAVSVMVALEYALFISSSLRRNTTLKDTAQWPDRIPRLCVLDLVVHIRGVRHLCCRVAYVGPAAARGVPCWVVIWVLCAVERISGRQVRCGVLWLLRY